MDHLKEWLPDLVRKAVALLLEFHHIFSLEQNEIQCTDATEHIMELLKDASFKERFWHIAPPFEDEGCQRIGEMLDGSAIPVAMVQCHGAGEEEGWVTLILH